MENAPHSGREVINPQRRYGDMPPIVLTAGRHPMPPGMPADVREQAALYFRALASANDAYAALVDAEVEFFTDDNGKVSYLILHQGGQDHKGIRK
jgi:hypothetical protein